VDVVEQFSFKLNVKAVSGTKFNVTKDGKRFPKKAYADFKKDIDEIMYNDLDNALLQRFMKIADEHNGFEVEIDCHFEIKNSENWGQPKVTTPDLDNLTKGIFDQVLGRIGIPDGKIFKFTIGKWYAETSSIEFKVKAHHVQEAVYKSHNNKSKKKSKELSEEEQIKQDEMIRRMASHDW